jgi:hypothetical protein
MEIEKEMKIEEKWRAIRIFEFVESELNIHLQRVSPQVI